MTSVKTDKPLIELRDVYKIYPRKKQDKLHALDGISLKIGAGEIHGIVGQSGAGKSTLIRCLTALERPTSGEILVAGQNLSTLSEKHLRQARRSIGMVFQAANLLQPPEILPIRCIWRDKNAVNAMSGCKSSWIWWGCMTEAPLTPLSFPGGSNNE